MELGTSQISYNRLGRGLPPNQHWKYCVPSRMDTNACSDRTRNATRKSMKWSLIETCHPLPRPLIAPGRRSGAKRVGLAKFWRWLGHSCCRTGLFSLTLFVDRMMLYWYSNEAASAAMAAGDRLLGRHLCSPWHDRLHEHLRLAVLRCSSRRSSPSRRGARTSLVACDRSAIDLDHAQYRLSLRVFGHEVALIDMEVEYFQWLAASGFAMGASAP